MHRPIVDALVRGRAHQRDRVVVFVQRPGAIALGHGLDGAEVHHVERADRHDLRNPRPSCRPEPIRPGAEHATYDLVAPLGGRHVHDAADIAVVDQSLHGATASARRVEDEHFEPGALQALAHGGHAGVVTPNIVAARRGRSRAAAAGVCRQPSATMPAIAPAALARIRRDNGFSPAMSTTEYISVMSLTSTYGVVLPDAIVDTISFGTPTGSVAHRGGDHRRAPSTAQAECAIEPARREERGHQRTRTPLHRVDSAAAIAASAQHADLLAAGACHVG